MNENGKKERKKEKRRPRRDRRMTKSRKRDTVDVKKSQSTISVKKVILYR